MLDKKNSSLKQQLYTDLTIRARGGIFIYLAIWLFTALWAEIHRLDPVVFYANTLLIIALSIFRAIHFRRMKREPLVNVNSRSRWLILMILASALHWGLLSVWVIEFSEYQKLHYPYMIIIAAFAMGGTVTLSISREIRIIYPLLIFMPSIIIGIINGGSENYVLVTLAIFSLVYVLEASRLSSNDYWEAIKNHQLATQRAIEMEHLSTIDPLTGLKNRMYFNRKLSEEWKQCNRLQVPISIMMMDLDHFKKINDTYGHVFGDECLIKVADTLKKELPRATDTIARYGGEEFVILLPDTNTLEAENIAERLVKAISLINIDFESKAVGINCCIGLFTTTPDQTMNNQMPLIHADKALYQAKAMGRNQWCTATGSEISAEI